MGDEDHESVPYETVKVYEGYEDGMSILPSLSLDFDAKSLDFNARSLDCQDYTLYLAHPNTVLN